MSSSSKVWYAPVENGDDLQEVAERLSSVLNSFDLSGFISPGTTAQIKLHFGEEHNKGHVSPVLVRVLSHAVDACGGTSVISDTNTLYRGRRTNGADHLALAREHGFTDEATGGRVVVADEKGGYAVSEVPVHGRFVSLAKVLSLYVDAPVLIGLAHFKGHLVSGFGGSLKNIGMGCATREGKLAQHSGVAPFVIAGKCTGCGTCSTVCPVGAISLEGKSARLSASKCIGCASCIAACAAGAVELDWGRGAGSMSEKMVEYAAAVMRSPGKKVFINFALRITAECDCIARDDPRIVPDVGILISTDPVAIDQAGYDLVCEKAGGFDPFRRAHPQRDCTRQLDHAEGLGIGTRRYELFRV